jgi:hypothetical protein
MDLRHLARLLAPEPKKNPHGPNPAGFMTTAWFALLVAAAAGHTRAPLARHLFCVLTGCNRFAARAHYAGGFAIHFAQ